MNEHPQRLVVGKSPDLIDSASDPSGPPPLPLPSIESTPEFAERVGAQFVLVEELKEKGASEHEVAAAEKTLHELLRHLRQRAPQGAPSFQEGTLSLHAQADILGELQHRLGAGGPLSGNRVALPFWIELLRPQQEFNLRLATVLRDLPAQSSTSHPGNVSAWIRRTLEPLANPSVWKIQTHRSGLNARAVMWTKKSGMSLLRGLLQPAFEQLRGWNLETIELLCTAHGGGPLPTRTQARDKLARMEKLADLHAASLRVPEALREAFTTQQEFSRRIHQALARQFGLTPDVSDVFYRGWCAAHEPMRIELATRQARQLAQPPGLSVVVGASPVSAAHWRECVSSVLGQTYDLWELCVAGPEPVLTQLRAHLPSEWANDSRMRFIPSPLHSGQAGALNTALSAARGEAMAFLAPMDKLAPHALAEVALALRAQSGARLFYTDEDRLDGNNHRQRPLFKPDWSRDMQRESNYASRLLVARRELYEELGGMREGFEGAELMDFILRASEQPHPIAHLPEILYHRRGLPQAFQVASATAYSALAHHLSRCEENAEVWTTRGAMLRVRHRVKGNPCVSVIVSVQDQPEQLSRLWRSLRSRTRWENWQLLLVHPGTPSPRMQEALAGLQDPRVLALTRNTPQHVSALHNFASRHAKGELLLFLDGEMEVEDEGWMEELIAQAQRPEVGLVGPMLLGADGRVRHAGLVLGLGGLAASPFWGHRVDEEWTPFGRMDHARNYLALSGACLMVRRDVFEAVGGYDERFLRSGADVDLALRIGKRGMRCVYTPHTRLMYSASASPQSAPHGARDAWLTYASIRPWLRTEDPFYNPHLTLKSMGCGLRTDERSAEALAVQLLAWELLTQEQTHCSAVPSPPGKR